MAKGIAYPEQRDIRAVIILLATQGMIRLGEIPDPLSGQSSPDLEGARFYVDLLQELQRKTAGNLLPGEASFLEEVLGNLRQVLARKKESGRG